MVRVFRQSRSKHETDGFSTGDNKVVSLVEFRSIIQDRSSSEILRVQISYIGPAKGSGNEVEGIKKSGLRPMVHIGNRRGRADERRGKARRLEGNEGLVF